MKSKNPILANITKSDELLVWDALIAWKDDLLKKTILRKSKSFFLFAMAKLIENGILLPEQTLSEFVKIDPEERVKLIDEMSWASTTKMTRKTLFRSFCRFAKQSNLHKTTLNIPSKISLFDTPTFSPLFSANEDRAKSQCLTNDEINLFLLRLREINLRDFLIVRCMWELKARVNNILKLKVSDYDTAKEVFYISDSEGRFSLGRLREDLRGCILELCKEKEPTALIFTTDNGKAIHLTQITRSMRRASKHARLPVIVTPSVLFARSLAFYKEEFDKLPEEEKAKVHAKREELSTKITGKLKNLLAE